MRCSFSWILVKKSSEFSGRQCYEETAGVAWYSLTLIRSKKNMEIFTKVLSWAFAQNAVKIPRNCVKSLCMIFDSCASPLWRSWWDGHARIRKLKPRNRKRTYTRIWKPLKPQIRKLKSGNYTFLKLTDSDSETKHDDAKLLTSSCGIRMPYMGTL